MTLIINHFDAILRHYCAEGSSFPNARCIPLKNYDSSAVKKVKKLQINDRNLISCNLLRYDLRLPKARFPERHNPDRLRERLRSGLEGT